MAFELPALPYGPEDLAPTVSAETIEFHYGKHHQTYVNNLNNLVEGTEHSDAPLERIVAASEGGLFNNAAQVWNHTFYWNCMTSGGMAPSGELADAIEKSFGSVAELKSQFIASATGNFGSGWTWLVAAQGGGLEIENTSNADTPIARGRSPILTCDVWEHAYYIDYRNARPKYLEAWWELVNWEFAGSCFGDAGS